MYLLWFGRDNPEPVSLLQIREFGDCPKIIVDVEPADLRVIQGIYMINFLPGLAGTVVNGLDLGFVCPFGRGLTDRDPARLFGVIVALRTFPAGGIAEAVQFRVLLADFAIVSHDEPNF